MSKNGPLNPYFQIRQVRSKHEIGQELGAIYAYNRTINMRKHIF